MLPPPTHGELWTGSLYTSTYRAGVCISSDGKMRGALLLKLKNGDIDVYHFYGNTDVHDIMRLYHNAGHRFEGNFLSDTEVTGKVTLANGFSLNLTGHRQKNVILTKTCRPLPE